MRKIQGPIIFGFAASLLLCSVNRAGAQGLTVTNPTVVSEVRSGRTTFDYTMRADVVNTGAAIDSVTATLTIADPNTTVLEGKLTFENIPAGGTVASTDTFKIRHNRSVPFNSAVLQWSPDVGLTTITSSPANGEPNVAITRETIINFSNALAAGTTIDNSMFFATFGGNTLPGRIQLGANRRKVTLFYDDPLPASARVRVTFIGDTILDDHDGGRAVDADNDGTPGGTATIDFDTLSLTAVAGTAICGRIFDEQLTMTGENIPLGGVTITAEGVTVMVDGMETTLTAVTDPMGNFRLEPAPAGEFFVVIDGRTTTSPVLDPGEYYPTVGKSWESIAGDEVNLPNIFLPKIAAGTLQAVSDTEDTVITAPPGVPELDGVTLMVPAGSLYSDSGQSGGMVGIAPVDPGRLPGELPPGLNFSLVITVQTAGMNPGDPTPTNFDEPVPICFPNLPQPDTGLPLAPGEESALWSFNHDTGEFEVVGPMTVTADGMMVCTDPGVGILAPGWHGQRPGTTGNGGEAGEGTEDDDAQEKCNVATQSDPPMSLIGGGGNGDTNPVLLYSGEKYEQAIDLTIKGVGMDFIWARSYSSRVGPNTVQGKSWDFSYNLFLLADGRSIRVCNGAGRDDSYVPMTGQTDMWCRNGFFEELKKNLDHSYTMTQPNKKELTFLPFDGSPAQGKISSMVDRNGNTMTFAYDAQGRLVTVTDTLDRDITIAHNGDGFIASVTDFIGRSVVYKYYGNNEPGGSFGDLKSATSPAVTGTPNGNDFPEGKTTSYTYSKGFPDGRLNHNLLTITDGRRNEYLVNIYATTSNPTNIAFDRVVRQIRGGDIVDLTYVRLTPAEPDINAAVTRVIVNDRNGNVAEHFFDVGNRLVRLLEYTGRANPTQPTTETANRPTGKLRASDPGFFETRTGYNRDFLPTRIIHPNGNITEYVYESEENPNVSPRARSNLRVLRRLPGTHTPVGDQAMIEEFFEHDTDFSGCCGSNFVTRHVDGRGNETIHDYDDRGNRIRTTHRIPGIVEDFTYNARGQIESHTHPDNGSGSRRVDAYTYYETGTQRGYREAEVVDAFGFALPTIYDYDAVGNVVRKTDPKGNDTQYVVNELDQVVREISREVTPGSGVRYEKDFFYDANDNLVRVDVLNIDADLNVVAANPYFTTIYEYEILNFLTKTCQESGSFDVPRAPPLLTCSDPMQMLPESEFITTEYAYDGNRNRILTRFGEATNGNQPTNVVAVAYDERDLLFRQTRGQGGIDQSTAQSDYDRNGNLIRLAIGIEGTLARVTDYVYDGYDRMIQTADPMGNVTAVNYDENSNPERRVVQGELDDVPGSTANIRLRETAVMYDEMDRRIQGAVEFFDTATQVAIGDGKSTTQTFWSDNSQIVRVVNDNDHESLMIYDTANRAAIITDAKLNTVTYEYDLNSNRTAMIEVEKSDLGSPDEIFTTTFTYDGLDRLESTTDNVGNTNIPAYDSRNNRTVSIDALGNRIDYVYDGVNRLTETVRLLTDTGDGTGTVTGQITTLQTWDNTSRLVSQTDDNGNTTTYLYDPLNRKTGEVYADGTSKTDILDVHDNAVATTDANGNSVSCQYDLLDRLIRKDITVGPGVSDDTTFEDFKYDGISRLIHAADDDSLVTRSYDSLSRVTSETLNGQTTACVYDGVGNQTECTYPGGRVITCTYDELERKKTISDGGGTIATYDYVGSNRVTRREYGNGTRTDYEYDGITGIPNLTDDFGVRRIVRTAHTRTSDGAVIDDRTYTWDAIYNKTQRKDIRAGGPRLTHDYVYDSVYRLIRSDKTPPGGPAETITYTLDGIGNRITVNGGPNPGAYTLDNTLPEPADLQVNQYTSSSFDARRHDANGSLTGIDVGLSGERTLGYDYKNRLVEHTDTATAVTSTYAYDPLHRRIEKNVGGATPNTTRFFYHDWQVIEEHDVAASRQSSFVYGRYIDEVLASRIAGISYYYYSNDLHSVIAVTDLLGAVEERYDYADYGTPMFIDRFGNELAQTAIANPYSFTGRRWDPESRFYYFRNRHMDAKAGRFLTRDPVGNWTDRINLGNAYTYVGNSPARYTDPYGEFVANIGPIRCLTALGTNMARCVEDSIDCSSIDSCSIFEYVECLGESKKRFRVCLDGVIDTLEICIKSSYVGPKPGPKLPIPKIKLPKIKLPYSK